MIYSVGSLNCLEVDSSQKVLFLGGSVAEGGRAKNPILCAMTFDSSLKLIDLQKVTDDPRMMAITALKRHSNNDILFAGTFDGIMIVQWIQSSFYFINLITTNSPTPVIDICFHRGKLYAVSEFKTALMVAFGEEESEKPIIIITQDSHSVLKQSSRDSRSSQFTTTQQGITYHPDKISENSKLNYDRESDHFPTFTVTQASPIRETLQPNFITTESNHGKQSSASFTPINQEIHSFPQKSKVTLGEDSRRYSQSSQGKQSDKPKIDFVDPSPVVPPEFRSHQLEPPAPTHVGSTVELLTESKSQAKTSTGRLQIPVKDQDKGRLG